MRSGEILEMVIKENLEMGLYKSGNEDKVGWNRKG